MKRELSPQTVAITIGAIALVIVVVGFLLLGPSLRPSPPVKPQPFTPPAGYRMGTPGMPMGPGGKPVAPPAAGGR